MLSRPSILDRVSLFAGSVLLAAGCLGMAGWLFHVQILFKYHESLAPIHFNTALGFALLGGSLLAAALTRKPLSALLAFGACIIGGLALTELVWDRGLGIDHLLANDWIAPDIAEPGHMAPNSGLFFLVLGLVLIRMASHRRKPGSLSPGYAIAIVTALLFSVLAISYYGGIRSSYGWQSVSNPGTLTGTLFVIAIVAIGSLARSLGHELQRSRWLSIAASGIILALTATFWNAVRADRNERMAQLTQTRANTIVYAVDKTIDARMQVLDRLAERWEEVGGTPEELWRTDAQRLLRDLPGFQAIEWADDSFHVRYVEPEKGNESAIGLDLSFEPRLKITLENARDSGYCTTTRVIDLVQGGKGFLIITPIGEGESFDGFILGVCRVQDFFDRSTLWAQNDFDLTVWEGDLVIYGSMEHEHNAQQEALTTTNTLSGLRNNWTLNVHPKQELLASYSAGLDSLILGIGLLLAAGFGWLVYMEQTAGKHILEVRAMNERLSTQMAKREKAERALVSIRQDEQERIRRDLHDGIGQQVTGIGYVAKSLYDRLMKRGDCEAQLANEILQASKRTLDELSDILHGLTPVGIQKNGIVGSLQVLAHRIESATGIECTFDHDESIASDNEQAALALYRIAQECISNSVKHAQPSRIGLSLVRNNGSIVLSVSDDGTGIPANPPSGSGMSIMRERAKLIKGEITVGRDNGTGTRITCTLPAHVLEGTGPSIG